MELVLIAIVALVILAGVDADLWPRPAPQARRVQRAVRRPRRTPARAARYRCASPRLAPGYARPSTRLCTAPRWWWE